MNVYTKSRANGENIRNTVPDPEMFWHDNGVMPQEHFKISKSGHCAYGDAELLPCIRSEFNAKSVGGKCAATQLKTELACRDPNEILKNARELLYLCRKQYALKFPPIVMAELKRYVVHMRNRFTGEKCKLSDVKETWLNMLKDEAIFLGDGSIYTPGDCLPMEWELRNLRTQGFEAITSAANALRFFLPHLALAGLESQE